MRIIVVGNGIAGVMCAKFLRQFEIEGDIEIFAAEKNPYYPRPNLIGYLAGTRPYDQLFAFDENWYGTQGINVHLDTPVESISPHEKSLLRKDGKKESYDILVLAAGSNSFIPPFKGTDKKGVAALWNLDDCEKIISLLSGRSKAAVIGGGLLGLEISRAARNRGVEVEVIEYFPRLLPRQLDVPAASLLARQIEKMGIRIRLNAGCEEILGDQEISGLQFKDGSRTDAEVAIIAAGARPDIRLARHAGLETDQGVIVDDGLKTGMPDLYAVGDITQHRGKYFGIIPACFEQAKAAAANIAGEKVVYSGTTPSNTLKVVGLDVASIGIVNPEDDSFEEIRKESQQEGMYKKIVLRDNRIVGAIWMGTKKGAAQIGELISEEKDIAKWKNDILEDNFDFSVVT